MLVTLATTEGVLYEDTVSGVTIPTMDGEITILPHHAPLVSALKPGEMRIVKDGVDFHFVIMGGVLEMRADNTLMILATDSIATTEIDTDASRVAYDRAEKILAEGHELSDEEIKEFKTLMTMNFTRMNAGKRFR
jgi:F-type H+-transporting ATPase subunit epsilon